MDKLPEGKERDFLIYKEKGHLRRKGSWYELWNGNVWVIDFHGIKEAIGFFNSMHDESKFNWSTSRNDAWELWDELPYPKVYQQYSVNEHRIIIKINNILCTFNGTSFALAVSKAWIEWKRSNK